MKIEVKANPTFRAYEAKVGDILHISRGVVAICTALAPQAGPLAKERPDMGPLFLILASPTDPSSEGLVRHLRYNAYATLLDSITISRD